MCRHGLFCNLEYQSTQLLHLHLHNCNNSFSVHFSAIYAKSTRIERLDLWSDLICIQQRLKDSPWIVGGDFNVIASMEEFAGPAVPDVRAIGDFTDFLSKTDLRELPTAGGLYTWVGTRSRGRIWKKLDRILFNDSWLHQFPNSSVELLSRGTSAYGYGMYKFSCKLRRLRTALRVWNKNDFGNVFRNARLAEDRVKKLENVFDASQVEADLANLNRAQADLLRSLAEEEDFWRQKARIKWLQEGDSNTKFFHSTVLMKKARLAVTKLKDENGVWVEGSSWIPC